MGRAYDYAYRPTVGDPANEDGGPCDDRPHSVSFYAAEADPSRSDAASQSFQVCPEHESQLRRYDDRLRERGLPPRFRPGAPASNSPGRAR